MPVNHDISRVFSLYAELLQLHQKEERLADLLSGAAYRIRQMDDAVTSLSAEELSTLFRPPVVSIIEEIKRSATIEAMDELVQLTPQGLFDMMRIKGLGGKKLAVLWKKAKIDNVEDLLKACKENKLSKIPGFGAKTEQNIIAAIETLNSSAERFHCADVADIAMQLVAALQKQFKGELVSLCGEVRRQASTVEAIEIITTVSAKKLAGAKRLLVVASAEEGITHAHTLDEIPVTIYHTTATSFYRALFIKTGNEAHVSKVLKAATSFASEEAIYKKARFPFIPPELREDVAEWEYAKHPVALLTDEDIKGVVHNHTTWSDGVDKLEAFVKACIKKGYEYTVISDHSKKK